VTGSVLNSTCSLQLYNFVGPKNYCPHAIVPVASTFILSKKVILSSVMKSTIHALTYTILSLWNAKNTGATKL